MKISLNEARNAYLAGDLATALGILQQLNDRDWGRPELMLRLGQVHFRQGDHKSAQGLFQEVSRLDPDGLGAAAREGIAECLLAHDLANGSTEWLSGRIRFLMASAQSYRNRGYAEDALRCWRRVLSLEPAHGEALSHLEAAGAELKEPEPYGWVG